MNINAVKTHIIQTGESLTTILDRYIITLDEKTIVAITSKVISLCQGRVVAKKAIQSKDALIKQEADAFLEEEESNPYGLYLTIKENRLIPSAGIDESNGDDAYILYPKDIQKTAALLWNHLKTKHNLEQVGIIITDSHTTPLKRGVTGICLGWCGFDPLYSYIGKEDLHHRLLRTTYINNLDALAASAVFVMGEGSEQTPFATIQNAPKIEFMKTLPTAEIEAMINIPIEEDIYAPLLRKAPWHFNKKI